MKDAAARSDDSLPRASELIGAGASAPLKLFGEAGERDDPVFLFQYELNDEPHADRRKIRLACAKGPRPPEGWFTVGAASRPGYLVVLRVEPA